MIGGNYPLIVLSHTHLMMCGISPLIVASCMLLLLACKFI